MEKTIKIETGKSLSEMIEKIVKESIKSKLHRNAEEEKSKQNEVLGEEDEEASTDTDANAAEAETSSKTVDTEKEKLKKGDVEPKDIVDKLNAIRSGKSFKDDTIASKLDEYVNSLTKAERVALLAFLKGLSQIVTGEVEADAATDPADPDPAVKMKKGAGEKQTKSIKPNIIKAPEKEKTEKKPSSEDTSGPVPITPKKK